MKRVLLLPLLFILSACGIGGNGSKDSKVIEQTTYHQYSASCQGLDLSTAELAPAAFRQLVGCLTSNDQMPAVQSLIQSANDEDLAPLTQVLSRTFLSHPERVHQWSETLKQADQRSLLTKSLDDLSKVLENSNNIYFGIKFLSSVYFLKEKQDDPQLLKALSFLFQELELKDFEDVLAWMKVIADSKAFSQAQKGFESTQKAPALFTLNEITNAVLELLHSGQTKDSTDIGGKILELLAAGEVWPVLDHLLPEVSEASLKNKVPEWAFLLGEIYSEKGRFFNDTAFLFSELEKTKTKPVSCFSGQQKLKALTPEVILSEMDNLNSRNLLLGVFGFTPFCEFSSGLKQAVGVFSDYVMGDAGAPLENVIRAVNKSNSFRKTLIEILSQNPKLSTVSRLQGLHPLFLELKNRDALQDALLISLLYKTSDRLSLQNKAKILTKKRSELGQKKIFEVLAEALNRTEREPLVSWLGTFQEFIDEKKPLLGPLLADLQNFYYLGSVHPVMDGFKDVFQKAEENGAFFQGMLQLMTRNPSISLRALSELSQMAKKEDGRLRSLLLSFTDLLKAQADRGTMVISAAEQILPVKQPHHNLSSVDLSPHSRKVRSSAYAHCRDLDYSFNVSQYSAPGFEKTILDFTNCLLLEKEDAQITVGLDFFMKSPMLWGALQNKTLFSYTVDTLGFFGSNVQAVKSLTDSFLKSIKGGSFPAALSAMSRWIGKDSQSLINPLIEILARSQKNKLKITLVAELSDKEKRARLLEKKAKICEVTSDDELLNEFESDCKDLGLRDAIEKELERWENSEADKKNRSARMEEIISEYLYSVDLDSKELKKSFSKKEVLGNLSETFSWLVNKRNEKEDPARENQYKSLEGLVHYLKSFNSKLNGWHASYKKDLKEEDQTLKALSQWFLEQATALYVLPYFYPQELKPRVRLVNGLDILGLLLLNAEAKLANGIEPGIMGLNGFSFAWKEESAENRPDFARNDQETFGLKEVIQSLRLGISDSHYCSADLNKSESEYSDSEKSCYAKIKNLKGYPLSLGSASAYDPANAVGGTRGLLAVLFDHLQGKEECAEKASDCLGVKMVRNLFSALTDKTPVKFRDILNKDGFVGGKNNMKTAVALVRLGSFRAIGQLIFNETLKRGDEKVLEDLQNFLKTGATLSQSHSLELITGLLQNLLQPDELDLTNTKQSSQTLLGQWVAQLYSLSAETQTRKVLLSNLFYTTSAIGSLGLLEAPTEVAPTVLRIFSALLKPEGGRALLVGHSEMVRVLLTSPVLGSLVQEFFKDSKTQGQWNLFKNNLNALLADPAYDQKSTDAFFTPIFEFLQEPDRLKKEQRELYNTAVSLLVKELEAGRMVGVLSHLAAHPEEAVAFHKLLKSFIDEGQARELSKMLEHITE